MPELPIFLLPQALRAYSATKLDHTPDDICPVCLRAFGATDDDDDDDTKSELEIPCDAMQLTACNHRIGSVCLKKLRVKGIANCPFCATPMELGHSPVHPVISYLASTRWFREGTLLMLGQKDDLAEQTAKQGYGRYCHHELAQFEWLNLFVFAGVATGREALELWKRYVELLLLSDLIIGFSSNFFIWIILAAIESCSSPSFHGHSSWTRFALAWLGLEVLFLLIKLFLRACSTDARIHFQRHEFAYHFFIFRTAVAVWSTTCAILIEILDNLLKATLVGVLISYGIADQQQAWKAVSRETSSWMK